jgi:hypothetical protein
VDAYIEYCDKVVEILQRVEDMGCVTINELNRADQEAATEVRNMKGKLYKSGVHNRTDFPSSPENAQGYDPKGVMPAASTGIAVFAGYKTAAISAVKAWKQNNSP